MEKEDKKYLKKYTDKSINRGNNTKIYTHKSKSLNELLTDIKGSEKQKTLSKELNISGRTLRSYNWILEGKEKGKNDRTPKPELMEKLLNYSKKKQKELKKQIKTAPNNIVPELEAKLDKIKPYNGTNINNKPELSDYIKKVVRRFNLEEGQSSDGILIRYHFFTYKFGEKGQKVNQRHFWVTDYIAGYELESKQDIKDLISDKLLGEQKHDEQYNCFTELIEIIFSYYN